MVTAVTNTSSSSATSAASSASSVTGMDTSASQDRFLKLLVAQLNNQDPMNPMDNAQMTTQLAQINTVSGIQQLNQTVTSLVNQFSTMQMLQGSSLVGHDVLVTGSTLTKSDTTGKGGFSLPQAASDVTVNVLNASGTVVDSIKLGALAAGNHTFESDLSQYNSSGNLSFAITATNGSQAVQATPLVRDTVTSIGSGANGMSLTLSNGNPVDYSNVKAVL